MLAVQEKKRKVDAVIQQLALQACQNTIIGSTLDRGVSGGEVTTCISPLALPSHYSPCSSSHMRCTCRKTGQQMPNTLHVRLLSCRNTSLALPRILHMTCECGCIQACSLPATSIFCALRLLGLIASLLMLSACCCPAVHRASPLC